MTDATLREAKSRTEERRPWHKPEVMRLTISVDTRVPKTGSGEDLGVFQPYTR